MPEIKIQRCQSVKIKVLPPEIQSYYSDLQVDYKKVMKFLVENSGMGYLVWNADKPTIVNPCAKNPNISGIIDVIGAGGVKANNCYGLFYDKYKPMSRPKSNSKIHRFAKNLNGMKDEDFDKEVTKLDVISPENWHVYKQKLENGVKFEDIWDEIAKTVGNPNKGIQLVSSAKAFFPKISRADNCNYCTALMDMVVSAFSSWIECHKNHLEETAKLEENLKTRINECEKIYNDLLAFSDALEENNYGLSKKVLTKSLTYARKNIGAESFFAIPFNEIKKKKYKSLVEADDNIIFRAYNALKVYWKLQNRKKYISMPRLKDYQVPFGLTGKGMKFNLTANNNSLTAEINGNKIECFPSHYFSDLQVTKGNNGFALKFRHKLKDKKKEVYGDWIVSEVKEIKIQKKENGYFLYLPYAIHHDDTNFKLEKFFMSVEGQLDFEDKFNVAAFDLNISVPLTMAVGSFQKNGEGPINALGMYGDLKETSILCKNTSTSDKICALKNKVMQLTQTIRAYKSSIKNSTELDKEVLDWLQPEDKNYRKKIQSLMSEFLKEERALWFKCRKNGHNNLSESIRLLELMDATRSLHNSYNNIHIFERTKQIYGFVDQKRVNFRDFVSKQYASHIVKCCKDNQVRIAFVEDLELKSDFDNDNNSIGRLFSPGQLKKVIKEGLNKIGIGCVFVACAGTSRKDPVSGGFGYRNSKQNKTALFVERDNKIGKIHADIAAALNILIVGLNHSVFPYKFWVKKGKVVKQGKRLQKFLSIRKLTKFKTYTGYLYPTTKGFITQEEKQNIEKKIKDIVESDGKIENFDISGNKIKTYNAFSVYRYLTDLTGKSTKTYVKEEKKDKCRSRKKGISLNLGK